MIKKYLYKIMFNLKIKNNDIIGTRRQYRQYLYTIYMHRFNFSIIPKFKKYNRWVLDNLNV